MPEGYKIEYSVHDSILFTLRVLGFLVVGGYLGL